MARSIGIPGLEYLEHSMDVQTFRMQQDVSQCLEYASNLLLFHLYDTTLEFIKDSVLHNSATK